MEVKNGKGSVKNTMYDEEYTGDFKNFFRHGTGSFVFFTIHFIIGKFKDKDGNIYTGEWKFDLQHGMGRDDRASKQTYVGEWENGKYHGQGTYTYVNGNVYTGR